MFIFRFIAFFLIASLLGCQMQQPEQSKQKNKKNLTKAATYNMQLGVAYLKQGDRPRAQDKLQQALKQNPNSPEINTAMAYYFEQGKQYEQARRFYQKAIALAPNAGASLNNYGAFLCRQGQYQEANQYFMKASQQVSYVNAAGALENAGLCALESHHPKEAIAYFQQALDQDGNRQTSFEELVKLHKQQEDYNKALTLIRAHPEFVINDINMLNQAVQLAHVLGQKSLEDAYKKQKQNVSTSTNHHGAPYDNNNSNG